MKFAYLIEPPFNYVDEDGRVKGCDVELASFVSSQLGTEAFELIEAEFAELLPSVAQGRWRMTTGLFGTRERKKTASFSRPIWALPDGLLVARGNPHGLNGYRSLVDNSDIVLAVIRDQFQHLSALEFGLPEDRILIFETYTEAAFAVQNGRAAAYASVGRAHSGFMERNPELDLELIVVPRSEKEAAFGSFAFSKADKAFRHAVNEVLDRYLGSNEHRTMMQKYGFSSDEVDLLVR
jgi:polar amino acid transport system substrate-binding protein